MVQHKDKQREWILSDSLFYSLQAQTGWTRPTHIGGGPSALLRSSVQMLISSGNASVDTLRIMFIERLRTEGEGDDRGWDGWMASLTQWTWASVDSGSWWWTGRPGMLWFIGWQRVGHNWVTELNIQRSNTTGRHTHLTVFPDTKSEGMEVSSIRSNTKNLPELKTWILILKAHSEYQEINLLDEL